MALPLPQGGVVPAYETFILDNAAPLAFTHVINALTGQVVLRYNEVDYAGEPKWEQFPAYPGLDYSSTDTRETWCWEPAPDCERVIAQDPGATPVAWDVDPTKGPTTHTTLGNNARSYENWDDADPFSVGREPAQRRPQRDYQYPWTNQWYEQGCSPDVYRSDAENDIDAATSNLFAGHNQMHDWSYRLGFTETTWNAQVSNFERGEDDSDPEQGNAQAGARVGVRDNANQITPPDGQAGSLPLLQGRLARPRRTRPAARPSNSRAVMDSPRASSGSSCSCRHAAWPPRSSWPTSSRCRSAPSTAISSTSAPQACRSTVSVAMGAATAWSGATGPA